MPAAVPYANLTNPQTLNLYAIVRDNPVSYSDLDGHQADGFEAEEELEEVEREKEENNLSYPAPDHPTATAPETPHDDIVTGICYVGSEPSMRASEPSPDRTASDPVRRDSNGRLEPDPEAKGAPHTQLGTQQSKNSPGTQYRQTVEYDKDGNPIRITDHTDHGFKDHSNPHYRDLDPKTQKKGPNVMNPPKPDKPKPPPPQKRDVIEGP